MFSSRFMVLMLLGSIVTGPQRAWLSGSPVAQSVIFMPGRLFQRCYANRWTSLTPRGPLLCLQRCFLFSPLLAMSRAPLFTSFCTTSSSKMVPLLFENSAETFSFMQEPQILVLVLSIPLRVCKLNQLRSPRWKGAQSVEVLGRFCARQNNMNTIFSAPILVWIIPQ